jgi:N-acyl-L-homoserine lactone synthetase
MQIRIVTPAERWKYCRHLMEMHHHRKQVFIDRLGWKLAAPGSWLEVDEFDNECAIYLMIVSGPDERHLGSVRLLPSTGPHLLSTVFRSLCPGDVPTGPTIWEISRLVAAPEGACGTSVLKLHRLLAAALVDFAELNGIERYTLVAEARRIPALLSVGWSVMPLSLPVERDGEMVEAVEILLDENSRAEVRRRGSGKIAFASTDLRSAA